MEEKGIKTYKKHSSFRDTPYKHSTAEITIWLSPILDANLWNMLHLLVHPIRQPLSPKLCVQVQKPKLLEGEKRFDALRDLTQMR